MASVLIPLKGVSKQDRYLHNEHREIQLDGFGYEYQCLNQQEFQQIKKHNEGVQEESHSYSHYAVMCFMSSLNGLFAVSKPSGGMANVTHNSGVAIIFLGIFNHLHFIVLLCCEFYKHFIIVLVYYLFISCSQNC